MIMRIAYYPFLLCCLLSCCMSDDYQNPVVDSDHPDPGALALPDGSGYVIVSTGVQNGNAYPIMSSVDLVNWQKEGFVFPSGRWPSWALGYMWAPEIHYVNHQYHVYFSAKSSTNQKFCLGVARSCTSHHMIRIDIFSEHQVLLDLLRTLVTHSWRTSTLGSLTSIGSVIQ